MKCCHLLVNLCPGQKASGANNNNSLVNNKNDERPLWLDGPVAAGAVERRLSWSPVVASCRDIASCYRVDGGVKQRPSAASLDSRPEPAAVHRAVAVNVNRSLPGSLDSLVPWRPVKTVLLEAPREKSRSASLGVAAAVASGNGLMGHVPVAVPKRRFLRLVAEGDVQVCRTGHSGTVIGKILGSKLLRRWETHHLYLNDAHISSRTVS